MKPLGLKSRIVELPLAILVAVFHGSTDIHLRTRRGTRETSDPTMKRRGYLVWQQNTFAA